MNDRIMQANSWRRDMVSRLVSACRFDDAAPIDRALLAVNIPAGTPGDTGFSASDLNHYRSTLIDRADNIEAQIIEKGAKLEWMKRKAESLAEKSKRLAEKSRRVGGTVSRAEYAPIRAEAARAAADVTGISVKIKGLASCILRMAGDVDAHRGAAALLGDVLDARRVTRTQALKSAPIGVLMA